MTNIATPLDCREVFTITEEETAAIQTGDIHRYLAILSADAAFLPPNTRAKTGEELRCWLADFLNGVEIRDVRYAHGETLIRDDLATHEYTCSWAAAPRSGGTPASMAFKGLHLLRRGPDGAWKISRNIWNAEPAGSE